MFFFVSNRRYHKILAISNKNLGPVSIYSLAN